MNIGKRIRDTRKNRGLNQTELAKIVGVNPQTICKYEKQVVTNIPVDQLCKIAKALNTSVAYLIGEEDDPDYKSLGLRPLNKDEKVQKKNIANEEEMQSFSESVILDIAVRQVKDLCSVLVDYEICLMEGKAPSMRFLNRVWDEWRIAHFTLHELMEIIGLRREIYSAANKIAGIDKEIAGYMRAMSNIQKRLDERIVCEVIKKYNLPKDCFIQAEKELEEADEKNKV